jgi:EAL domain-containing protein (putative c-di-GMP-specific phosphodiesterase class I)
MHDVDRWVVTNAIDWMIEREKSSEPFPSLSINLSGNTLNDDYFLDFLTDQLARSPALPGKICFEVTETSTITNLAKAADFIHEVKKIGCKFALDDFGTGMSSYEYLKRLPVDYLKIDGCFITDIMSSPFDYAVVKSINEIGQFMGKKTVAEFVETEEIRQLLEDIGVDYVQGYGIEKPRLLSEI